MDAALQAFEDARATRALRTDYDGHALTRNPKGVVVVDMGKSRHRQRNQHEGTAANLARAYVASHPELATAYGGMSIDQLVLAVDAARAIGDIDTRAALDAWLMAKFAPQVVLGEYR